MTETTLARARAGDGEAFGELIDPYRGELLAHCYRILGSVADAEDVLQEALLAAWRSLSRPLTAQHPTARPEEHRAIPTSKNRLSHGAAVLSHRQRLL